MTISYKKVESVG